MRLRWIVAGISVAICASAAPAQSDAETGVTTETQERLAPGGDGDWDLLGLLGLLGLFGLRRPHSDESYHPATPE